MFFKIGVLKNLATLEPLFNEDAGILLQNNYGTVAVSGFSRQQILFLVESGFYC